MHGDFSRFQFGGESSNERGILHQQGRVLLDHDVNALTYFSVSWQETAARDLIGAGVAAVGAENPSAGRITSARVVPHGAMITLRGGRVWANGSPIYCRDGEWRADYIAEPSDAGAPGTRDAVLLETWFECVSGFQDTKLLEPALGGPDTTVRVINGTALRLVRMEADEHCDDVVARQGGDPGGRLTVRLEPAATLGDADCPIEDPGGYRGPEHHMYRIEMAHTNDNVARFKWSRFNGGLLAQGTFDAATDTLRLQANHRAVATADLPPTFYVEALAYDADRRAWNVIYGGRATLANDHEIDLTAHVFGVGLPGGERIAVRIWDGLEDVSAFPAAGAPLRDGILVAFTEPAAPGDFWTFVVRAGQANPEVLIDDRSAEGVQRSRVALGTVTWSTAGTVTEEDGAIADCRRPFAPLTSRDGCCTIRVGDGVTSHGDVRTLQEAFDRLPPEGGTVCVLPGEHAGGHLREATNVTIHGCGLRSKIVPPSGATAALQITDCTLIRIHDLYVDGGDSAAGIALAGSIKGDRCRMIDLARIGARAATRPAIVVEDTARLAIHDCLVVMADAGPAPGELAWTAIVVDARDAVIERNTIEVQASQQLVIDPRLVRGPTSSFVSGGAQVALGGVWLRGGCQRVRVVDNDIIGGTGHGIVLGHAELVPTADPLPGMTGFLVGWPFGATGPCAGCIDGGAWIPWPGNDPDAPLWKPGPGLGDIEITRNRIRNMGMAGIAVAAFFAQAQTEDPMIEIERLVITSNTIERCLARELDPIPDDAIARMGYGAIALAEVHDLEVTGNRITDNGTSRNEPVCGVYVTDARHAAIRDNAIAANGRALTGSGDAGPRAGVWIQRAEQTTGAALLVHGNDIAAPTGPALRAMIDGGAAITDNRFASASLAPGEEAMTGTAVRCLTPSAAAAPNVLLQFGAAIRGPLPQGSPPTVSVPLDGDAKHRIVFSSNRVLASYTGPAAQPHCAIAVIGFDDIGFADNTCSLASPVISFATNATISGRTIRVTGSRFQETGVEVVASAVVLGALVIAGLSIADHCIVVSGIQRQLTPDNIEHGGDTSTTCATLTAAIKPRLKL